ncbi:gastrula zinc finger protein XFG20-1 [Culex quinquefasciatus]|uniref:Gastrula zinc finger protein XFG20-1 n=1 Tax=Culex quinquefasciatus TaxID=7176 RepID=B0WSI9_CULQU|nr:gastrula zinc finger protein XFG20-1 [Culex quinquefasciatus]|eukprot:XP_001852630.1 gastrula zinc finger protein XFG20-1 [Culex quinquefasciatus]
MAAHHYPDVCRFCGEHNDVIVDLISSQLCDKLVKYFPLKFDSTDSLPKVACTDCASIIQQTEGFILKAQETERNLLAKTGRPQPANNVLSPSEIRSLASKASQPKSADKPSLSDVLQKLGSGLTVKKVQTGDSKSTDRNAQVSGVEQFLAMKMEVLDDEVENIPTEDLIQYNDTDDEDAQREAQTSFNNIVSVNVKESHSDSEEWHESYLEEALSEEGDEDYTPTPLYSGKRKPRTRRHLPKPKPRPRAPAAQSVVINLKDPCHFVCVTCKGKFSSFEELQGHLDQSVACKKVNSTCEVCGKVCANRKMLSQHKLTHSERPQYVCDQCGKVYSNVFNLENHKSQVHGDETDFGYVYKCCDLTFKTRRELNEHTATHTKILNLLCDACGKSFTSQKALKSHAMSHTNIRPFSCDMCQKAFRTKLLLVQHAHVHTGVKAFNCDICEKAFAKKESLRKHYKTHSTEPVCWSSTGEKLSVKPIQSMQQPKQEELQTPQIPAMFSGINMSF